jgi:hypothetical protein
MAFVKIIKLHYIYKIALIMQLCTFCVEMSDDDDIHDMLPVIRNIVFKQPVALTDYLVVCVCVMQLL